MDASHSIVQMPPGISVATVGINAGMNAAVMAVQILALSPIRRLQNAMAITVRLFLRKSSRLTRN